MAQPYVGEIRMFAGTYAPADWMFCDGQILPIAENETLFQVIRNTYGGDGVSTFALPDMRGRIPIHNGAGFKVGDAGGAEEVTLDTDHIPSHTHGLQASPDPASGRVPAGQVFGRAPSEAYASEFTAQQLSAPSITPVGGGQPHTNFQPYLCVQFIISLSGLYPTPS
ncbi:phage tail protein [Caenimonas aquaedulcis]|uniref:Phage tail protein n=1 Tax=Caenimonas aquaedulcis TaxID=2793270 RepID=A0A931H4M3_9BURK|nr:tail fiber protein [Caenimonas aquaedulcis]MBG9388417.1 phage tail protein [Caenimonas aquaedulcis]